MDNNIEIESVFNTLLKEGIGRYMQSTEGSGKITATYTKEQLYKSQGVIIETIDELLNMHQALSHFTPNVFRSISKTKEGNTCGHKESNLKQINTIVVDFDHIDKENVHFHQIMYAGYEGKISPTLILDTPKGYQAYFIFDKPMYVKSNETKAISVAKRFSENIRAYFNEKIPGVDLTCNHFGYFRTPKVENILYFDAEYTYSYVELLDFSIQYEIKHKKNNPNAKNIVPFRQLKNINEPWFHHLLNTTTIHGDKGLIGRDNAIFTLALQMYASKCSIDLCLSTLQSYNAKLEKPLSQEVVISKVKSAYSGEYKGPSTKYILPLLRTYCNPKEVDYTQLFFRKHAKKRSERVRSHLSEWKKDIETYIHNYAVKGHVHTTTRQLCDDIGIPRTTLYKLLKKYDTFLWSAQKGKHATITITTIKVLNKYLVQKHLKRIQAQKINYQLYKELIQHELETFDEIMTNQAYEGFQRLIEPITAPKTTLKSVKIMT